MWVNCAIVTKAHLGQLFLVDGNLDILVDDVWHLDHLVWSLTVLSLHLRWLVESVWLVQEVHEGLVALCVENLVELVGLGGLDEVHVCS